MQPVDYHGVVRKKGFGARFLSGIALVSVTVLLFLGAAEVLLRATGFRGRSDKNPYAHSILGTTVPPNTEMAIETPEYFIEGGTYKTKRSNNFGFYDDHDTTLMPPPGVHRIAVLGDSQTACECGLPESWAHVLEAHLNGSAGSRAFEVINAGVGRYSPYQYLLRAKLYLLGIHPEHIVVGIYVGNDLNDLTRQDDRPYLTAENDGRITSHPPYLPGLQRPGQAPIRSRIQPPVQADR
jgi:hypothetical protein